MSTLVAIPMKDPGLSKTRLSPVLDPEARAKLAMELFRRTLSRLSDLQCPGTDLAVVTGSEPVTSVARAFRVRVLSDPGGGLNAALEAAADVAKAGGYERLCIVPADLAAPEGADLAALLAPAPAGSVRICPATDGGTNGLNLAPKSMALAFGPASAAAHVQGAQAAGLRPLLQDLSSLAHDIDTPDDLARVPGLLAPA